jgi:hypothetical protein
MPCYSSVEKLISIHKVFLCLQVITREIIALPEFIMYLNGWDLIAVLFRGNKKEQKGWKSSDPEKEI